MGSRRFSLSSRMIVLQWIDLTLIVSAEAVNFVHASLSRHHISSFTAIRRKVLFPFSIPVCLKCRSHRYLLFPVLWGKQFLQILILRQK